PCRCSVSAMTVSSPRTRSCSPGGVPTTSPSPPDGCMPRPARAARRCRSPAPCCSRTTTSRPRAASSRARSSAPSRAASGLPLGPAGLRSFAAVAGCGVRRDLRVELLEHVAASAHLVHDPVASRLARPRVVEDAERHAGEEEDAIASLVALLLLALELVRCLREIGDELLEILL